MILHLQIDPERTVLASATKTTVLEIGVQTVARFFRQMPPTPEEIEAAINVVEDEIMREVNHITKGSSLCADDPELRTLCLRAGIPEAPELRLLLKDLEIFFTRIAVLSLGRPLASDPQPLDVAFVARLLILRELMHHLSFPELVVT